MQFQMRKASTTADSADRRSKAAIAVLIPVSALIVLIGISVGSVGIDFLNTLKIIFTNPQDTSSVIIWGIRMPRVLLAFLTGAAMSVGGAVTQSVLHNPLASPYTLGVSSGASVGAAIVTVLGISLPIAQQMSLAAVGTAFGILTVLVCVAICSRIDKNVGSTTIVLLGMVMSLFLSAVFTLVAGTSKDKMTVLMRWQMGSFGSKGWEPVAVLLVVTVLCVAGTLFCHRELDILSFSDESALSMGVNAAKIKWALLILTAIMTSTAVSFAGVIGFVDLIAPHVARRLFSPKHKYLLVISALIGGSFMVIADLAARTLMSPTELPVGAVTAFIGAPFFAYVYFSHPGIKRRGSHAKR